jgi:mono/diheme cytochrome c family protein
MAEEVEDASAHFTDSDLAAIATYLKDVSGSPAKAQPLAQSDSRMAAGKTIFRDTCSACHGLDGGGVPHLFPSLAKAPSVRSDDPSSAIRVLLRGARSAATAAEPTAPAMPSFGWQLNDNQAAAVLTYIRNSWGAAASAVSAEDVGKARSKLAKRRD